MNHILNYFLKKFNPLKHLSIQYKSGCSKVSLFHMPCLSNTNTSWVIEHLKTMSESKKEKYRARAAADPCGDRPADRRRPKRVAHARAGESRGRPEEEESGSGEGRGGSGGRGGSHRGALFCCCVL